MENNAPKPLLSIIVPTKNRYYYLNYLLDYFTEIKDRDIELVIQDNSNELVDKEAFISKLEKYNDPRVKYSFEEEELSVIENSDRALLAAQGEYICFIGDDDIFSKYLISYVRKSKENDVDAILPIKASYNWPDIHSRTYGNSLSGKLKVLNFTGIEKEVKGLNVLNKVLYLGGCDILDLPRVYHGIIKHSVLKEIYTLTGSYFPGPSPDMANAVALSLYVKKFIVVDIPFVISGHSFKSGGGQGAAGKHFGEIRKMKHLPADTADLWTPEIPFYWSGYTIYAESLIQALKRMKNEQLLKQFNYNYFYAHCLVFDRKYAEIVKKTIKENKKINIGIGRIKIYYYLFVLWAKRVLHHAKIYMRIIGFNSKKFKSYDLNNNIEVAVTIDKLIETSKYINTKY